MFAPSALAKDKAAATQDKAALAQDKAAPAQDKAALNLTEDQQAAAEIFEQYRKEVLAGHTDKSKTDKQRQFFKATAPLRELESEPMHLVKAADEEVEESSSDDADDAISDNKDKSKTTSIKSDVIVLTYAADDPKRTITETVKVNKSPLGWTVESTSWDGEDANALNQKVLANFFQEFKFETTMLIIALALCIPLSPVYAVAAVWQIILAFKQNVWWGLGSIFVPFVPWVFMIMHYKKCKWPIILLLVNLFLFFAAAVIVLGVVMTNHDLIENHNDLSSKKFHRISH